MILELMNGSQEPPLRIHGVEWVMSTYQDLVRVKMRTTALAVALHTDSGWDIWDDQVLEFKFREGEIIYRVKSFSDWSVVDDDGFKVIYFDPNEDYPSQTVALTGADIVIKPNPDWRWWSFWRNPYVAVQLREDDK